MTVDDRRRLRRPPIQVSTWRGDDRTAVVTASPDRRPPTADDVEDCLDRLVESGFVHAITGALHAHELDPFISAGFIVRERLHLLRIELDSTRPRSTVSTGSPMYTRRARRSDRNAVLRLDHRAFDDFWALDAAGLHDAVKATPVSRFRVWAEPGRGSAISGYAVTGRAGGRGYIQRLAVDPDQARRGIGGALVADALAWLSRGGATVALVNTQDKNRAALGLYLACGFHLEPSGLTVMERPLRSDRDR